MLQYFVPETLEYCDAIDRALATMEEGDAPTHGAESPRRVLMRMWHTIKGAANSIGLATLGRLAHALEDACEEGSSLTPAHQRAVAAMATDLLRGYLRECTIAPAGTVPPPPEAAVDSLLSRLAESHGQHTEPDPAAPGDQVAADEKEEVVTAARPEPVAPPTATPAEPRTTRTPAWPRSRRPARGWTRRRWTGS